MKLREDEATAFDVYFASLASMNMHPGTTRDPPREMTLQKVAELAHEMIAIRRYYIGSYLD